MEFVSSIEVHALSENKSIPADHRRGIAMAFHDFSPDSEGFRAKLEQTFKHFGFGIIKIARSSHRKREEKNLPNATIYFGDGFDVLLSQISMIPDDLWSQRPTASM